VDQHQTAKEGSDAFYPSEHSRLGRVRRWMWMGAAFGMIGALAGAKASLAGAVFAATFVLAVVGTIDWFLRRRLVTDRAAVVLDGEGIQSPLFTGRAKRHLWRDVAQVSVESDYGAPRLRFRLAGSSGCRDRRDFWTGINPCRPAIPLTSFDPLAQERLVEAVSRHLHRVRGDPDMAAGGLAAPLLEEREFQARLKGLAPIPWVTWLLVALNVMVWGVAVVSGAEVRATPAHTLFAWGGNAASAVQQGEWWRLLTALFLHGGVVHLTMNMLGLAGAGIMVERIYGHRLFALIYLGTGLVGGAASLHFSAQQAVSVGASGAVFGITGALLVGVFQHRRRLPKAFGRQTLVGIGFFVFYSLMQGFAHKGVDNAAHVGGLLAGAMLALVLPERFDMAHFARNLQRRAVAAGALVLVTVAALIAASPPAALDMQRLFDGHAAFVRGASEFDVAVKALQREHEAIEAGRIGVREADERSRTVYAPMFARVVEELSRAALPPSDPRTALLEDLRRMAELIHESLAMESVFRPGSDEPEPIDPVRAEEIEAELMEIGARLERLRRHASEARSER